MTSSIGRHIRQERAFRTLQEEVFVGLYLAANRLMERWERHLKARADLTHVQYNVLRILRGAGRNGLLIGEIAERLLTRSPDVTRLIDRLEQRGLVCRHAEEADRRAVRVQITAAGLERIAPLDAEGLRMLGEPFDGFGPGELEQLRDMLGRVLDSVVASE